MIKKVKKNPLTFKVAGDSSKIQCFSEGTHLPKDLQNGDAKGEKIRQRQKRTTNATGDDAVLETEFTRDVAHGILSWGTPET